LNDPNGLVYHDGVYHMFYQYHPANTQWGPMHWGHASSTNLIDWQEEEVALAPDGNLLIFSGSVVIDVHNTSGLGTELQAPWVALFTHHDMKAEKEQTHFAETQSLAYSLDHAKTWVKYPGNPVLGNPGERDFRDPKVFWHVATQRWVMLLAVGDHVSFYHSTDLTKWRKSGTFGALRGAQGGVWECPDLISMVCEDKVYWALLVSLNPGGPAQGSGTQYFIGDFDGNSFSSSQTAVKWLDYGPDNYAGVTFHQVKDRHLMIAWMSNWLYAQLLPTHPWRGSMTVPRELHLRKVVQGTATELYLASLPAREFLSAGQEVQNMESDAAYLLSFHIDTAHSFSLGLSNELGESLQLGYAHEKQQFFIDRRQAGVSHFSDNFASLYTAPRVSQTRICPIQLLLDRSSLEFFADEGLSVLTTLMFPSAPFKRLQLQCDAPEKIALHIRLLRSSEANPSD
jgi:fructan beta-fructosidase